MKLNFNLYFAIIYIILYAKFMILYAVFIILYASLRILYAKKLTYFRHIPTARTLSKVLCSAAINYASKRIEQDACYILYYTPKT